MILKMIIAIIAYLVLAPVAGCFLAGLDRKLSARMQGRVGPSVLQPFYDVTKLFDKEPQTVTRVQDFYVMLFVIFVMASGVIFFAGGDLLLVIFVLAAASAFLIIAAYSSHSPYAKAGADRELLQMMAYEPMLLITAIGFYLSCGSFAVRDILMDPSMPFLPMIGMFVGFVFILTIKFRKAPFDLSMSHSSHQELAAGITTEFSGRTLGLIQIAHWYETVLLLGFVFLFFANGTIWGAVIGVIICIVVYLFEILMGSSFARMKWQTALKASWIVALVFGVVNIFALYLMG